MLTKNMKFPATFELDRERTTTIKGVVLGVLPGTYNDQNMLFYGYTSIRADLNYDALPAVWNREGKCLIRGADGNGSNHSDANLKFPPRIQPGQVKYEYLTADQRAILKLIIGDDRYADNYPNNYLVDILKVPMCDTDTIIDYAIKKEFK